MKMTRDELRRVAANFVRAMRERSLASYAVTSMVSGGAVDLGATEGGRPGERLLVGTHAQGRAEPALVVQYATAEGQAPMMLILQPGQYIKLMLTADAPLDGYDAFEETPEGFMQDRAFAADDLAPILVELDRLAALDGDRAGGGRVRELGREFELVCAACGARAAAFRWGNAALDSSRALAFAALGRGAAPVDDHLVYFDQRGEQQWTFRADDSLAMAAHLRAGALDELNAHLRARVSFRPVLDAYCPDCDACFCAACSTRDESSVTCRAGHVRALGV